MLQDCAEDLTSLLRDEQKLLVLSFTKSKWTVVRQSGDGWVLDRDSPQLHLLKLSSQSPEPCLVMDSHKDPRFERFRPEEMVFRSSLCLPLRGPKGEFLGAVLVEDRKKLQSFGFQDVERWSAAALPLAKAIQEAVKQEPSAPRLTSHQQIALGVIGFCGLWVVGALWSSRAKPKPPVRNTQVIGRNQASPEIVASSVVAALVRNDFQAAYALTASDPNRKPPLSKFQTESTAWKGSPENIRSLQYRRAQKIEGDENHCRVEMVGTGPAAGRPSLTLELVRQADGWRWEPPWVAQQKP